MFDTAGNEPELIQLDTTMQGVAVRKAARPGSRTGRQAYAHEWMMHDSPGKTSQCSHALSAMRN